MDASVEGGLAGDAATERGLPGVKGRLLPVDTEKRIEGVVTIAEMRSGVLQIDTAKQQTVFMHTCTTSRGALISGRGWRS